MLTSPCIFKKYYIWVILHQHPGTVKFQLADFINPFPLRTLSTNRAQKSRVKADPNKPSHGCTTPDFHTLIPFLPHLHPRQQSPHPRDTIYIPDISATSKPIDSERQWVAHRRRGSTTSALISTGSDASLAIGQWVLQYIVYEGCRCPQRRLLRHFYPIEVSLFFFFRKTCILPVFRSLN